MERKERHAGRQKSLPTVMLGEMISGDLFMSAKAEKGMLQFRTGPQKCVLIR